ncbi:hypothetical protein ACS0TY_001116 [Phlomoides rotata]
MASSQKIVLKCSDNTEFEIDEVIALESQTLKHMIEDVCDSSIPVPNVTAPILGLVIEYCKRHMPAANASVDDLKSFDDDFTNVDQGTLFDLMLVCFYYFALFLVGFCVFVTVAFTLLVLNTILVDS